MMKSSVRSKSFFKRGTSDPTPPLAEAQLYWCRRRMGPGESALITEALNKITVRNQYPIPKIDDLLDQLKGEISSTRLT
jgi:hypothetical protein